MNETADLPNGQPLLENDLGWGLPRDSLRKVTKNLSLGAYPDPIPSTLVVDLSTTRF